ncbi:YeiH family protein [Candidatus Enterococcus ferrettii]|uniref:Sulfate exporter family transporter n=1 Tax=Candidatus Enterococcus ferrettii TaxID=2815324 RepID=A0ABV0F058_9ENTE|nr:putative sulfate exporter family transporter [Enterococcus sp. 665A]MBO1340823.1 putative sulfate exporter family transporter [Enterococcus sp. 665A]
MNIKNYSILPGLLLSFAVAAVSKALALFFPEIGGATIAILLGILLGNTIFRQPVLAVGTKFSESRLLEYSVVLLGFTVTFQTISEIGLKGIIYVLLMMTITIIGAYLIGKKLGFSEKMGLMMAGGNAVCGSSAIGAIAPAIGAKDEEKGQVITLVNLLGTIMMLTLPFLGIALFGDDLLGKSALLGGTLQSVGQVVAGASLIDTATVKYAMLFKIMRIMLLVVVVFVFEQKVKQNTVASDSPVTKGKKLPVPWYVIGFLIACILNSFVPLPHILDTGAHFVSTWFETTALAAIGLRLDFKKFLKEGPRFLIYGVSVGVIQTISAVIFIFLLKI